MAQYALGKIAISIHAPTRGATCCGMICCGNCCYFNPRSYKRSDLPGKGRVFTFFNFNPRSYKRSDNRLVLINVNL